MRWGLLLAVAAQSQPHAQGEPTCPARLSTVLDSVAGSGDAWRGSTIIFSARASRVSKDQAWVVRIFGDNSWRMEVLRVGRPNSCVDYAVDKSWRFPLSDAEYRQTLAGFGPVMFPPVPISPPTPRPATPTTIGKGPYGAEIVVTGARPSVWQSISDGTGLEIRFFGAGQEARRDLNLYGKGGAAVSAPFYQLVAKYLPPADVPTPAWRVRN